MDAQATTAGRITQERALKTVMASRRKQNLIRAAFQVVLLILVAWSVQVTIIEDTDWERMNSFGSVMESAGRFVGIDFGLFADLGLCQPHLIRTPNLIWLAAALIRGERGGKP